MEYLTLQVAQVDPVVVDDRELAESGAGEVHARGRSKAAGADDQCSRAQKALLAFRVDTGQHDLAGVPQQALVVHDPMLTRCRCPDARMPGRTPIRDIFSSAQGGRPGSRGPSAGSAE